MPYVMIPAFPPSHQTIPVSPDTQVALPIQPIPCKPGIRRPRNNGIVGNGVQSPSVDLCSSLFVMVFYSVHGIVLVHVVREIVL